MISFNIVPYHQSSFNFVLICKERNPLDFNKLDTLMHQFTWS